MSPLLHQYFDVDIYLFSSSLAKVNVVKQKGNVNFSEDCKSENQKKVVFPSDATDLVTHELALKKITNKI